jgi:hypothetical protein
MREKGRPLPETGYEFRSVVIYRATSANESTFKSMDYVTRSLKFAQEHANHQASVEEQPQHVLKALVPSKNVFEAYNPGEYFYDGPETPGRVVYQIDPNQLEANYNRDTSHLEGEPFVQTRWDSFQQKGQKLLALTLSYHWKGYQILPHQRGYTPENQFAAIRLEQDADEPDYFIVQSVDTATPFRRQGYATELFHVALGLIKNKGFKGIKSGRSGRTTDSEKLWASFPHSTKGDWDYMEQTNKSFSTWIKIRESRKYTELELEQMPIRKLDKMAFGFHSEDVLTLAPDQITIISPDDLEDAQWAMERGIVQERNGQPQRLPNLTPQEWANHIDLSEPLNVHLRNGRFELRDGHHRYLAAKILNKPLKCQVTIDDNAILTILKKQV